jgi:ABC-type uncharacterized transport system permease subunit
MAGSKGQEAGEQTNVYRLINILIPIVSVLLGLIAGAIIMLYSGYNPIHGYLAYGMERLVIPFIW